MKRHRSELLRTYYHTAALREMKYINIYFN